MEDTYERGDGMKLREIREEKGVSQAELGKQIGVARQTIAAWENGDREPSVLQFSKVCKVLKVPMELLLGVEIPNKPILLFRADEQEMLTDTMRESCAYMANNYSAIETLLGEVPTIPETNHLYEYDPAVIEKVATRTRDRLGIDDAPLGDVLQLLEENGLKIIEVELMNEVSGFSAYDEQTGGVIFLNNTQPVERQFFTALHELGHMIFHKRDYAEERKLSKQEEKDRERIADHFAGAMLLPREVVESELKNFKDRWIPRPLLEDIKQRYKVSMRTVIVRAFQTGMTTRKLYGAQFSKIQAELGNNTGSIELIRQDLRRLKRFVFTALLKEEITSSRAAEILGKPLPEILEELGLWLEEGS